MLVNFIKKLAIFIGIYNIFWSLSRVIYKKTYNCIHIYNSHPAMQDTFYVCIKKILHKKANGINDRNS